MEIVHGDCLEVLTGQYDCIFADPPDNQGLQYESYRDNLPRGEYLCLLSSWTQTFMEHAPIIWVSFNSRFTIDYGAIMHELLGAYQEFECKPCVQVYTFGQHNHKWLGTNHRPLWCIHRKDAVFHPEAIRVQSWRQANGDKRADPRGRVPGDVFDMQYPQEFETIYSGTTFDFPRVTGNSRQRCDWHPTQLHEELVERCIRFSTGFARPKTVCDPFLGTGTTMKVCAKLQLECTGIDIDREYCENVADFMEVHYGTRPKTNSESKA